MLRLLRPYQWVKNVFVAAALVFSRHLGDAVYAWRTAIAVAAFCAMSGAVYAFNDVRDVEADRAHPTKCKRPIACGQVSERAALTMAALLAIAALAACAWLDWRLLVVGAIYLAQNVAYSVRLKHVAWVDIGLVAAGYILRVLGGAFAIDVPASGWLIACTALFAVFLGFGKRAHELAWAERTGAATATRASLAGYRLPVLRAAMYVIAVATVSAYVAYTIDGRTVAFFGTDRLVYSAPFVALGIARFLSLALWKPKDDPPTDAMLKDPWAIADAIAAAICVLYVIYR